jgi:hypothetical protein
MDVPDGSGVTTPLPFTISLAATIERMTLSQSEVTRDSAKKLRRRKPLIFPLESLAV